MARRTGLGALDLTAIDPALKIQYAQTLEGMNSGQQGGIEALAQGAQLGAEMSPLKYLLQNQARMAVRPETPYQTDELSLRRDALKQAKDLADKKAKDKASEDWGNRKQALIERIDGLLKYPKVPKDVREDLVSRREALNKSSGPNDLVQWKKTNSGKLLGFIPYTDVTTGWNTLSSGGEGQTAQSDSDAIRKHQNVFSGQ